MTEIMDITHQSPTMVLRCLQAGYQTRFLYKTADGCSVTYGLQWRGAGTRDEFKDVVVVYVKGKDAASIKFSTIPVERLFEPLSDEKRNILTLENITVYPRDYTDFLATEQDLEDHRQVLFDKIAEYSEQEKVVSKKFARMLQGF